VTKVPTKDASFACACTLLQSSMQRGAKRSKDSEALPSGLLHAVLTSEQTNGWSCLEGGKRGGWDDVEVARSAGENPG
jgi:hypothetical protein